MAELAHLHQLLENTLKALGNGENLLGRTILMKQMH